MAKAKKRTPAVEEVRPYVEGVAKNLVDKPYGPAGPPWGTKLTDIEDLLLEVRDVLTERMLALSLARQAEALPQQPPATRCCPSCQQPLACEDVNPRLTDTRAGEAHWSEPQGYCPRCRRAFFPSGQKPGH
jgi:hypothetical protein